MITLGSSTSNRGLSFSRIRRRRGSKSDSGFSKLFFFGFDPASKFMEDRTLLASFLVINTDSSGRGSLRQAILDSDAATGGTHTIDFDIPGSGVQTIVPLSALPAITHSVLIDGFSQPGYGETPLIELSGNQAGGGDGLTIKGPDVTVRGLDINGFSQGAGIRVTGTGATSRYWVYGNFLGTDPTGKQALPNYIGVQIDAGATGNLVGTNGDGVNDASERNLISGNQFAGVWITGQSTSRNAVAGNSMGPTSRDRANWTTVRSRSSTPSETPSAAAWRSRPAPRATESAPTARALTTSVSGT